MDKLKLMEIKIQEICDKIGVLDFVGNSDSLISELIALGNDNVTSSSLFWCSDKNKEQLLNLKVGTGIISKHTHEFLINCKGLNAMNWLVVERPRLAFMKVLNLFFVEKTEFGSVANSSVIHKTVKYNSSKITIGENVVIEKNVIIGDFVQIGHNSVIKSNTIIHDNVKIGSNNTIGGVGFGYEINSNGAYEFIPHIGNVILKSNVEIGNNTCIDKAVLGSTILFENVKVDNLVHIAHGVKIKRNSLIIANSMIAGSVEIGENVWVSPSVSIMQKLKVNDDSLIGMGSVVIKNVEKSTIVAGVPAKKIKDK